jgi:hypothetical protein
MKRWALAIVLSVALVTPALAGGRYQGQRHDGAYARGYAAGIERVYRPPLAYRPPPLPYEYYYQQELQRRMQTPPAPPQSFEGSSPRCERFFCPRY